MAGLPPQTLLDPTGTSHDRSGTAARLDWLRAGVLGANDGIVSTAGLVIGVAGATSARGPLLAAGAPHADAELGIDPHALVSPSHAAGASALSFSLVGSLLGTTL